MIAGTGIDIVELDHMASVCLKQPTIFKKILTTEEQAYYSQLSKKRQLAFLCGRYAAKEAFSKAMGTGIGKTVTFQNVSILNNDKGKPVITASPHLGESMVSISHTKKVAVAQVILTEN